MNNLCVIDSIKGDVIHITRLVDNEKTTIRFSDKSALNEVKSQFLYTPVFEIFIDGNNRLHLVPDYEWSNKN